MVKQADPPPLKPRADRPSIPGYGIADASGGKGLLRWSWVVERMTHSHNYWVSTSRPDGRPHAAPVWGIWLDDGFYFSTGRQSRKARNLAANPQCVVSSEDAAEAVILEGVAQEVTDPARLQPFFKAYKLKYNFDMDTSLGPTFVVRPQVVFGFIEHDSDFTKTATRWIFDGK
jgi:pyridoxamine 5'-phosphate oxidase-like protein